MDREDHRVVNHFCVYAVDADFGPFFVKFCSYFPYNGRLCINGDEWAATVEDPAALQAICDRLGAAQIHALLDK